MLSIEARNAGCVRSLWEFIERSVAFPQGDDLLLGRWGGKKFAEPPHAAAIEHCV